MQDSLLAKKHELTSHELGLFLRAKGPASWWDPGKFWLVTSFDLGKAILKHADFSADRSAFFISRMPNLDLRLITDFFGVVQRMMVMSDGAEHAARRRIAASALSDERLESFRPVIAATVDRLLAPGAVSGRLEFVEDVAKKLPSSILADLFDIPAGARESFYEWSNDMTQFFGGASQYRNEDGILVNASACRLRDYFRELIAARRARPQDDFLSVVLAAQPEQGLTDEEVVSQAVMMLVAGQITTTDQICNNLHTLLTHPGALATLRAAPELLPTALEELNRWDPGVTFLFRVARADSWIGEQRVKRGDTVFISTHAVNRDPAVFDAPNALDLGRRKNPHFAYGHGAHFCLGARLARLQMQALFARLLERFPALRPSDTAPAVRKHHSLAFSGFERLPLLLDGQPRVAPNVRQDSVNFV